MISKELKIDKVEKSGEGVYVINDSVELSNISFDDCGKFVSDMRFNEDVYSENEAETLADEFIFKVIENYNKEEGS